MRRAPATINRYRSLFSLTFRLAIEAGKLTVNPVPGIRKKRENNFRERYLTEEEEARLRAVLRQHYPHREPELDIALHCGIRRGSQYALRWSDVDLERGILTLRDPKPGERQHVRLNAIGLAAFRSLRRGPLAELRAKLSRRRIGTPAAIPIDRERIFWDIKNPRQWWERACKLAGLEGFCWHDLRHTVGSRLIQKGVSLREVQEFLGHKCITTTLRYAHLAPDFQVRAGTVLATYAAPTTRAPKAAKKRAPLPQNQRSATGTTPTGGKTGVRTAC